MESASANESAAWSDVAARKQPQAVLQGQLGFENGNIIKVPPIVQRSGYDADADRLALLIQEHSQSLAQNAIEQLLGVKKQMLAHQAGAIAAEQECAAKQLACVQGELDLTKTELHLKAVKLERRTQLLNRSCQAYSQKHQHVYEMRALLKAWYTWRSFVKGRKQKRRLWRLAVEWHQRRYLFQRVFERWHGVAKAHYRLLVAQRHERTMRTAQEQLQQKHEEELQLLRQQLAGCQAELQEQAMARDKMEEEMKRAFMRGVTALNIEAMHVMKRGMPPSGVKPFPVSVPLQGQLPTGQSLPSCHNATAEYQRHATAHTPQQACGQPPGVGSMLQAAATSVLVEQLQRVQLPAGSQTEESYVHRGDLQQSRPPGRQGVQLQHKQNSMTSPGAAGEQQVCLAKVVPGQGALPRVTVTRGPAYP